MLEIRGLQGTTVNLWGVSFRFLAYLQTDFVNSAFIAINFAFLPSVQVSNLKVVVDKKDLLAAPTVQKGERGDKGSPGAPGLRGQPGSDVSNSKHLVMHILYFFYMLGPLSRVLWDFLEKEEQRGTKGNEALQDCLGLQVEPLESGGLKDPQGLLVTQASQEYQGFLEELVNGERLVDRVKR